MPQYYVYIPQDICVEGKQYLTQKSYKVSVGKGPQLDEKELEVCDAILARTAIYDRTTLSRTPKLKVIGRYGVGVDNIDVAYCTERGIQVTNAPLSNMVSVAEHTMFLVLACAKNAYEISELFRGGQSNFNSRNTHCGVDLEGKTLGIVGLGKIGRKLVEMARGFVMTIVGYDPYVNTGNAPSGVKLTESIEAVLQTADFVSLHMPSTKETAGLFNLDMFRKMKPSACFINASRGSVVVEKDLIKALEDKIIAGAGIDVFEQEPPAADNPLLHMKNVIATPHMAGLTKEAAERMGVHAAIGIDEVLSGKQPSWPVNKLN